MLKLYAACFLIFSSIDFFWVGLIARRWYQKELGSLLLDSFVWLPAISFYLLYPVALIVFVLLPSFKTGDWHHALYYGLFFGFTCYAAYDLTNLATIKNWPVALALCDMAWGAFVTGATTLIVFRIMSKI